MTPPKLDDHRQVEGRHEARVNRDGRGKRVVQGHARGEDWVADPDAVSRARIVFMGGTLTQEGNCYDLVCETNVWSPTG